MGKKKNREVYSVPDGVIRSLVPTVFVQLSQFQHAFIHSFGSLSPRGHCCHCHGHQRFLV